MKPRNIPTLDGWRAIAILLVMVSHSMRSDDPHWLWCGFFGVDIFFGISGFLITLLLLCEHESNGAISLRGFYIRRAFRILPPLFILLIVVGIAGLYRSRLEIAADLLFFRNYLLPEYGNGATSHLWSLSVEEHFYLIWPGLLALFGVRRMKNMVGHFACGIALWRTLARAFDWTMMPGVGENVRTDFRLDSLLWGCAMAFLVHDRKSKDKLTSTLNPF